MSDNKHSRVLGGDPRPSTTYRGFGTEHGCDSFPMHRDIIDALHQVVREVTGKPVAGQSRRIGFLP